MTNCVHFCALQNPDYTGRIEHRLTSLEAGQGEIMKHHFSALEKRLENLEISVKRLVSIIDKIRGLPGYAVLLILLSMATNTFRPEMAQAIIAILKAL